METSFLTAGVPLRQLISDLNSIYARKNEAEHMFTTPVGCLVFIAAALKVIGSEITKHDGRRLPSFIPAFMKRLFILVELRGTETFLRTLAEKYPASGCGYCHALPCQCGKAKAKPWEPRAIQSLETAQHAWSLGEWQEHHRNVYGVRNVDLSLDRLLNWENEEFLETFIAVGWLEHATEQGYQTETGLSALATELPDLFMRMIAIANQQNIEIEPRLVQHYGRGCPRCRSRFCICPNSTAAFPLFEEEVLVMTRPAP